MCMEFSGIALMVFGVKDTLLIDGGWMMIVDRCGRVVALALEGLCSARS